MKWQLLYKNMELKVLMWWMQNKESTWQVQEEQEEQYSIDDWMAGKAMMGGIVASRNRYSMNGVDFGDETKVMNKYCSTRLVHILVLVVAPFQA